jgi:hypothetical protein
MQRIVIAIAAGVLTAGLIGCAPPPPIRVVGSPSDLDSLAGEWTGTYKSRDGDRQGSIWFKVVAGEDHAHGDVLMTPQGRSEAYARYKPGEKPGQSDAPQFLAIRFVAVSKGEVSGVLEPYWDADCDCQAQTTYVGQQFENVFEGTFITRLRNGRTATGRWTVVRRRES